MRIKGDDRLASGENFHGDAFVHPTATIDPTSHIGPNVVIGANCVIGPGCRIYNSTIMQGTKVIGYTLIEGSIIGWDNTVGKWVRVNGLTVTAEDVQIKDELYINGTMIMPHKPITMSFPNAGSIVM